MFKLKTIVGLCAVIALAVLAACGQKGNLMLPKEPAAQNRATLPQILNPSPAASAPAPAASASKP